MSRLTIVRASPLTTIQDDGRPGFLAHGIAASGPMDASGYRMAEAVTRLPCGAAIECGPLGLDMSYSGPPLVAGLAAPGFRLSLDGQAIASPAKLLLRDGSRLAIEPGPSGNYGYLRFCAQIDVPVVLDSRATNATVGLGGLEGRALRAGDVLALSALADRPAPAPVVPPPPDADGPIRFIWGLHARNFDPGVRDAFSHSSFRISSRMDRMGVGLEDGEGVFADTGLRDLVSDGVVPGDLQILGDGSPIVLMRDHQPTGGYPRIATIISADLDRFAQLRPGTLVGFSPVTVDHAHRILKDRGS